MEDNFAYPLDPRDFVVCGIDEAGRGPLMGDVVASCVWLSHENMIEGLNDSKKLSEHKREKLAQIIKEQALAYGIGRASPEEIDKYNILNATYLAMERAFDAMQRMRMGEDATAGTSSTNETDDSESILTCTGTDHSQMQVDLVLIDGNRVPKLLLERGLRCESVVKGDAKVCEIAAASILAKTTRDADLLALDKLYPDYGFAHHKGYPTPEHLKILQDKEILPCYRRSFGPIRELLRVRTGHDPLPEYSGSTYYTRKLKAAEHHSPQEKMQQGSLLMGLEETEE